MKRAYIIPETEPHPLTMAFILAGSDGVIGGLDDNLDIGYGGVDEDGKLNPSANHYHWSKDEDWDKW